MHYHIDKMHEDGLVRLTRYGSRKMSPKSEIKDYVFWSSVCDNFHILFLLDQVYGVFHMYGALHDYFPFLFDYHFILLAFS